LETCSSLTVKVGSGFLFARWINDAVLNCWVMRLHHSEVILSELPSLFGERQRETHARERIDKGREVKMKHLRKMIAELLESLAVMLLIGTAAIFAAAQRMDPRRLDD